MAVALLASPEDFAAERGVSFDPSDVAAISALEQASDLIRGLVDQELNGVVTGDEVVLDGTGTRELLLPQLPVLGVSEVSTQWNWGEDPIVLVENDDYRVNLKSGILYRDRWSVWPAGLQNVNVTYDHGWSLPGDNPVTLPADVQSLCKRIALRLMTNSESGGASVQREEIGTYRITYDTGTTINELTWDDQAVLNRLRRHQMV